MDSLGFSKLSVRIALRLVGWSVPELPVVPFSCFENGLFPYVFRVKFFGMSNIQCMVLDIPCRFIILQKPWVGRGTQALAKAAESPRMRQP